MAAERLARIVVPLDGSTTAEEAVPAAQHLSSVLKAPLTLVQLVSPAVAAGAYSDLSLYAPEIRRQLELAKKEALAEATAYLDALAEKLRREGLTTRAVVERNSPAEKILEHTGDALIVMTTHGRSGPSR